MRTRIIILCKATVSRRWSAGYFQAAYTFSKSTDATSTGNTALNSAFNDEMHLHDSRGLSDFDRPQRFVVSYRYELPFFKDFHGIATRRTRRLGCQRHHHLSIRHALFRSRWLCRYRLPWRRSAIPNRRRTARSRRLHRCGYQPAASSHPRRTIAISISANFTFAPPADPAGCAVDVNACTTAFGNLGRNIYRGPKQQNWDFSLLKNFHITERQELRFTADFFNIWNHANFANPTVTDVENPAAFGKIFSTVGTPRLIQFSLRYAF